MDEESQGIKILTILKHIMIEINKSMHNQFKKLDLTGPQGMLIGILNHNGKMKVSDLSKKLGLSNSTVSGIIDRLEKRGFVQRIRSEKDRRIVYVDISEEFKEQTKQNFFNLKEKFETIIKYASPEEIEEIFKGLNALQNIVTRQVSQSEDDKEK